MVDVQSIKRKRGNSSNNMQKMEYLMKNIQTMYDEMHREKKLRYKTRKYYALMKKILKKICQMN